MMGYNEYSLRELGLWSGEEKPSGDLINVFKHMMRGN